MVIDMQAPDVEVRDVARRAVREDLIPLGDVTSALVPATASGDGYLVPREDGTLAGTAAVTAVYREISRSVEVSWTSSDGDHLTVGTPIATLAGPARPLLTGERAA